MKRNERITSSWGFLTQGAKTMMCLLVLMLSVQAVLAQGNLFQYAGLMYKLNGTGATCMGFATDEAKNASAIIIPDYIYNEGVEYPVTEIAAKGKGYKGGFEQATKATRLVIGNNVTTIGEKAFEHFGQHGAGPFVMVIGSAATSFSQKAFEHFAEGAKNSQVILTIDDPADIQCQTFEHCKNTTFYVKDEETYNKFKSDAIWGKYDGDGKGNHYKYPIPAYVSLKAGKWQTAVFPEAMTEREVESYFGKGTLLAEMSSQTPTYVNNEPNNYILHFNSVAKVQPNTPMLIKPGNKDCCYASEKSYKCANPVVKVEHFEDELTFRMIGICDADHLLTDGQIYFRNYGDGNMRFFMYKEGEGKQVKVKRGKCIWEIVDESGNVVTNKALDYKIDDAATAIEDVTRKPAAQDGRIYSLTGQYEGTSLENLPKGIHIMNGRKFVVK